LTDLLQVALDAHDIEWTFVIKSWPNGGENKRVYVMEKTGIDLNSFDFCGDILPVHALACIAR